MEDRPMEQKWRPSDMYQWFIGWDGTDSTQFSTNFHVRIGIDRARKKLLLRDVQRGIIYILCSHLKALNKAFDPLGNSSRKSPETVVSDVVETSGDILRLAESLSKRLLGTYTQVRDEDVHLNAASTEKPSPAQLAAKEVFTNLTSAII